MVSFPSFYSFGDNPVLLRYCPVQRPFCIFLQFFKIPIPQIFTKPFENKVFCNFFYHEVKTRSMNQIYWCSKTFWKHAWWSTVAPLSFSLSLLLGGSIMVWEPEEIRTEFLLRILWNRILSGSFHFLFILWWEPFLFLWFKRHIMNINTFDIFLFAVGPA